MRAYVAITPPELQNFLEKGSFHAAQAFVLDPISSGDAGMTSDDQEEFEFELSWRAAEESRGMQGTSSAVGMALAVDLEQDQMGEVVGEHVGLLSNILWSQVQSLLISESEEPELSWFAAQEIPTYLPQWLA